MCIKTRGSTEQKFDINAICHLIEKIHLMYSLYTHQKVFNVMVCFHFGVVGERQAQTNSSRRFCKFRHFNRVFTLPDKQNGSTWCVCLRGQSLVSKWPIKWEITKKRQFSHEAFEQSFFRVPMAKVTKNTNTFLYLKTMVWF